MAKQRFNVKLNKPSQIKCPNCGKIFEVMEVALAAEEELLAKGGEIPVETIIHCTHCNVKLSGAGIARVMLKKTEQLN